MVVVSLFIVHRRSYYRLHILGFPGRIEISIYCYAILWMLFMHTATSQFEVFIDFIFFLFEWGFPPSQLLQFLYAFLFLDVFSIFESYYEIFSAFTSKKMEECVSFSVCPHVTFLSCEYRNIFLFYVFSAQSLCCDEDMQTCTNLLNVLSSFFSDTSYSQFSHLSAIARDDFLKNEIAAAYPFFVLRLLLINCWRIAWFNDIRPYLPSFFEHFFFWMSCLLTLLWIMTWIPPSHSFSVFLSSTFPLARRRKSGGDVVDLGLYVLIFISRTAFNVGVRLLRGTSSNFGTASEFFSLYVHAFRTSTTTTFVSDLHWIVWGRMHFKLCFRFHFHLSITGHWAFRMLFWAHLVAVIPPCFLHVRSESQLVALHSLDVLKPAEIFSFVPIPFSLSLFFSFLTFYIMEFLVLFIYLILTLRCGSYLLLHRQYREPFKLRKSQLSILWHRTPILLWFPSMLFV